MNKKIILVDKNDKQIGTEEKMKTHQKGLLHRAFSIFVFNEKHELLLQKRASKKYHSGGLWTNTCCSHPTEGEDIKDAAHRRLNEEMGFNCKLVKVFDFIYKTHIFNDNLFEHEFDHVFFGQYNKDPILNFEEAESFSWKNLEVINNSIKQNPEKYTIWFKIAFLKIESFYTKFYTKMKENRDLY